MNFNERFEEYLKQDWFQDEAIFNEAILAQDKNFRERLVELLTEQAQCKTDTNEHRVITWKIGKLIIMAASEYMPEPERDGEFIKVSQADPEADNADRQIEEARQDRLEAGQ